MDGYSDQQKQTIQEVNEQLPVIQTLPEPIRSQCLVCLAYEYFISDMEELAIPLLNKANPEYFKEQLEKDMKEDERMAVIVMCISAKLVELGIIKTKI